MLEEYVGWIGLDLAFQEIDAELAGLPGEYVPPRGALFVAESEGRLIGMIGLRPFDGAICEMKRLYVRPAFRAHRIGRALAEAVIEEGRARGFTAMRLDTLPTMGSAMALYESLGFIDIEPYRYNPVAGTRFLEKKLS